MRKVIKEANSEQLLEVVEECKGKGKVPLPVAIIVFGFDTRETDEILVQVAEAEDMKLVDYSGILRNVRNPEAAEKEWVRQINESMLNYRGVIIERNFGENFLTRQNMIKAAMKGMKLAKVIMLRLSADSMKGFMYHREKYGEEYSLQSKQSIAMDITYAKIRPDEHIDYDVQLTW